MKIIKITQEKFLELYNNKNLTLEEVAKQLKVKPQSIYKIAKELGVKRREMKNK